MQISKSAGTLTSCNLEIWNLWPSLRQGSAQLTVFILTNIKIIYLKIITFSIALPLIVVAFAFYMPNKNQSVQNKKTMLSPAASHLPVD